MTHFILRVAATGTGNSAVATHSQCAKFLLGDKRMTQFTLGLLSSIIAPICWKTALFFTDLWQS